MGVTVRPYRPKATLERRVKHRSSTTVSARGQFIVDDLTHRTKRSAPSYHHPPAPLERKRTHNLPVEHMPHIGLGGSDRNDVIDHPHGIPRRSGGKWYAIFRHDEGLVWRLNSTYVPDPKQLTSSTRDARGIDGGGASQHGSFD